MKSIQTKHVFIFGVIALILTLLFAYIFSNSTSKHQVSSDKNSDRNQANQMVQEKVGIEEIDSMTPDHYTISEKSVIGSSSTGSNDYITISFLNSIASNANSDVIQKLKVWEQETVEYLVPPTGDPDHTLFLFLPTPDEELNRQVDQIILSAFEESGMDPDAISAEVIQAVKGLTEWPTGNRLVLANADGLMEGSVVVYENISEKTINEFRNRDPDQYADGMIIDSSMMKLNLIDFGETNRFSHLYHLLPQ